MTNNGENNPATKTDPEMTQMLADKDIKTVIIVFHKLWKLSRDMEVRKRPKLNF